MRIAVSIRDSGKTVRSFDASLTPSLERPDACFGVACPVHGQCARYAAVNRSQADARTIATCQRGRTFPLFVKAT